MDEGVSLRSNRDRSRENEQRGGNCRRQWRLGSGVWWHHGQQLPVLIGEGL
jgi:hypothetical protein